MFSGARLYSTRNRVNMGFKLLPIFLVIFCAVNCQAHTLNFRHDPSLITPESENRTAQTFASSNDDPEIDGNCSEHSIEDFPEDLFTHEQRQHGAVLVHLFFGFYCFLLTAYVCNDYLLPALDCICADLRISADVAGATFLATASCFPELFVNVVGTFLTESDLGIGTVVGGAVFNTFATPAVGALFAAKVTLSLDNNETKLTQGIQLKWHILSRDCVIYSFSVGVLVIVMWDGLVTWYESCVLLLLFAAYFTLLFVNDSVKRLFAKIFKSSEKKPIENEVDTKADAVEHENYTMPFGTYKPFFHGELVTDYKNSLTKIQAQAKSNNGTNSVKPTLEVYTEPETIFKLPKTENYYEKLWFLFVWPIKFTLFITIPDSRFKCLRKFYPATFIMCVIWIAISSYLVSWMTTVVGDTIGIPDSVMGITFLAAGGNLPEMVSIVILSRQGHGDMAMSNTIGANTLDILLCLGLPWAIKAFMSGKAVTIVSGALAYSNLSIIFCVIGFYAVTALYGYVLNKKVAVACLLMYALFLVFAIMLELNVFFFVNLPMC